MTAALQIRVYDKQVLVFSDEFEGPVELGRQSESREGLYTKKLDSGRWRVVIASFDEDAVLALGMRCWSTCRRGRSG